MITTILTNALKMWFWTDETNVINVNKQLDLKEPFYTFIYITFTHENKKEKLNLKDVAKLPLEKLTMTINIEVFNFDEVKDYFKEIDSEGMINLDTEVDKVTEFITEFGYGVCDLVCGIYYFCNERGYIYTKPIFDPDNILPHVANMADQITASNPNSLIKTNLYIPEKKSS